MTLKELQRNVQTLPAKQFERFGQWFDGYRRQARANGPAKSGENTPQAQQEEILRRRDGYLADPSIATPIDAAFLKRLRRNLAHARTRQTTAA